MSYYEYLEMKEKHSNKKIEFKKVILTEADLRKENSKYEYKMTEYEIPEIITEVEYFCFSTFPLKVSASTSDQSYMQIQIDRQRKAISLHIDLFQIHPADAAHT